MSNADGDFDIYVVEPGRGMRRRLTDAPGRDGTPVWSPDGKRIAFQSLRDGHSQIYVMEADGGNVRNLSNSASNDEHPFWSADGARILFASDRTSVEGDEQNYDIFVMEADGSNVSRITTTPEVETYPTWSPDGSRIACRRILADGNWDVVILDAQGNDVLNLSHHPAPDGWPAWSPDGTRLVFASERGGSADLWLAAADGSDLRRITDDPTSDERQPWWSPDGTRIAFARYVWFRDEPFDEASEIRVLELDAVLERTSQRPPQETLAEIQSFTEAHFAAFGDADRFVAFYDHSEEFSDVELGRVKTWAEHEGDIRGFFGSARDLSARWVAPPRIVMLGPDAATVAGTAEYAFTTSSGQVYRNAVASTLVLRRSGDRWRILHAHGSLAPVGPPTSE
jgi:dipeptidyl aminopeptidase/acylaminoacyl peptidase